MRCMLLALAMSASVVGGASGAGFEVSAGPVAFERTAGAVSYLAAAAAPSRVTGYSDHCRERMLERRVGEGDVEFTVRLYHNSARYNNLADTWVYKNPGSGLTVVLNDAGLCVTVF
jgi:hypothetical protein